MNFDLKKKEAEYNSIKTQIMDLEHRFRLMQEEKLRAERDFYERNSTILKDNETKSYSVRKLEESVFEKERTAKDIEAEVHAYRQLSEEKDSVIASLKNKLRRAKEDSYILSKEKREVQSTLSVVQEGKTVAQIEADRLQAQNKRLSKEQSEAKEKEQESLYEVAKLKRELDELTLQIDLAQREKNKKDSELEVLQRGSMRYSVPSESTLLMNKRLLEETSELSRQITSLEIELDRVNKKLKNAQLLTESKEIELNREKRLSPSKVPNYKVQSDIYRLKRDNEMMQTLMDTYKRDVEIQKKLRNEEISQRLDLEAEKRKLEKEKLYKEIEATSAKRELEKIKDTHDYLLDSKLQMNEELEALKEHTGVLENQNSVVLFLPYCKLVTQRTGKVC